ncbi:putative tellurite resistance protein B-like protein [Hamadaea flava]|uniref:TerB family tellurite resistance protein n=1 Tax=Hamadaea flava TaxID=1742688 RepID=A0ABV8LNH3_9ACTN|nr:TerB family tellurite resistance protein [Hamadaea flava]MCP2329618.1 putative tellurite resistance protein B-like protein [Hamadaea flava]
MESGQIGLGRLKDVAGNAARMLADSTSAARQRLTEVAGDTQEMAKQSAEQVKAKVADVKDSLAVRSSRDRGASADLSALSVDAKLLYCRILVSLALVDALLDPREIANLYLFASTIGLDDETRSELRGEITRGQRDAENTAEVRGAIVELAGQLRNLLDEDQREPVFAVLVRDLVRISRADRHAADVERERIMLVAELVFAETAEKVVQETERLVTTEEEFASGKITTSQLETTTKDIAAKAAAIGVPITAVSLAGSVAGLSGAGITSGLAALGFGGLLGLSAMATGIGTVVILGVAVHQGTRYVLAVNEREREKRREHLIQQVIRHHQQAMAELADDIAGLGHRMEAYLTQTASNERRLATLRAELAAFQTALVNLQTSQEAFERREPLRVG